MAMAALLLVMMHGVGGSPDAQQAPKPRLHVSGLRGNAELGGAIRAMPAMTDPGGQLGLGSMGVRDVFGRSEGVWRRLEHPLMLVKAFLLWLVGGLFGLHHLYLGRNRAALRACLTLNYAGLGWLGDAVFIPRDVHRLMRARQAAQLELVPLRPGDRQLGHDMLATDGGDASSPAGQPATGSPPGTVRSAAGGLGSLLTGSARRVVCASVAAVTELIQLSLSIWLVLPAILLPYTLPPPARAAAQLPGLAAALALGPAGVTALQAAAAAAAAAAAWLHLSFNLPPMLAAPAAAAAPLPADQAQRRVVETLVPIVAARVAAALPWHRLALHVAGRGHPLQGRGVTAADRLHLSGGGGGGGGGGGDVVWDGSEGTGYRQGGAGACESWEPELARPCSDSSAGVEQAAEWPEPAPLRYLDPEAAGGASGAAPGDAAAYTAGGEPDAPPRAVPAAGAPSGRGVVSGLARAVPRRSGGAVALWLVALAGFWGALLLSCLAASQVPVSVDGALTTVNGLRFAGAWLCTLRPDRLHSWLVRRTEPLCARDNLHSLLGTHFHTLCLLPSALNRCFDWDVAGTRWARVGFSVADAYRELGLSPPPLSRHSARDIKAAYHRTALAFHPDKSRGATPEAAAEAAHRFMRAQRAYETAIAHKQTGSGHSGGAGRARGAAAEGGRRAGSRAGATGQSKRAGGSGATG